MTDSTRVFFRLERDEDDYPPVDVESLWVTPGSRAGEYVIDNTPFFIRDATLGDTISTHEEGGLLWFDSVVRRSENSLIRAVIIDKGRTGEIRRRLVGLGCSVETMDDRKLLAISIPPEVSLAHVQAYLQNELASGTLDYEEPILRQ